MRPLKASESIHDNLARDAAIAEMGRRLATQALRARQRQSGTLAATRDAPGPAPRPVAREDALAPAWPPPNPAAAVPPRIERPARNLPWARYASALRRVILLGATAACGFSLVLYAEKLQLGPSRHIGTHAASQEPLLAVGAPATPAPATEESLPSETLPRPPAERRFAMLSPLRAERVAGIVLPAEPARQVPPHARRLAQARPRPRLSPHVTLARFEFPRWLTERAASPPMQRILSEPPHDLAAPRPTLPPAPAAAPVGAGLEPAPRPQRARAIYAMAARYPSSATPYPLPPLRRPAFYTAPAPAPDSDVQEEPDQP